MHPHFDIDAFTLITCIVDILILYVWEFFFLCVRVYALLWNIVFSSFCEFAANIYTGNQMKKKMRLYSVRDECYCSWLRSRKY